MALIQCKECGKDVSSTASQCPNCGAPVREKEGLAGVLLPRGKDSPTDINWPLRIVVAIFFLVVALLFLLMNL